MDPVLIAGLGIVAGMLLGALVATLRYQSVTAAILERLRLAEEARKEAVQLRQQSETLKIRCAELERDRQADREKIAWAQTAEQSLREAFQSLAAQSLQANAQEFIKRAQDQLNAVAQKLSGDWNTQKQEMKNMVDPLQQSLKTLDTQVQALEQKREGAYSSLREQLGQLFQTHQQLQATTATLAQALKSSSVRGRWGEYQLRRVVEMAGMVKHVDFEEQQTAGDSRPDMVIHMPNGGTLPVDAKTPMAAYLAIMECPEEQRAAKLTEHAAALKQRVKELGGKQYWQSLPHAPEFVVMFVPNEASLGAAYEQDAGLLDYAMQQRVLPTTPVTLLALLKAVAYGWQQQQIADSAREIAEQGRQLYDRMGTLAGHLSGLGKHLNQTVDDYNRTVASMESRVLPAARRLREMGVSGSELGSPSAIDHQARIPLPAEAEDDCLDPATAQQE